MKKSEKKKEPYEAPVINVLTVAVERGFTATGDIGTEGGEDGGSEWED